MAEKLQWGVLQIQAAAQTFAAILADASVVAWGGDDARDFPEGLRDVQHLQASGEAFAAITSTGNVVT